MEIRKVYTVISVRLKKPVHFARHKVAVAVADRFLEGSQNVLIEEQSLVVFDNVAQFNELFPQLVKE